MTEFLVICKASTLNQPTLCWEGPFIAGLFSVFYSGNLTHVSGSDLLADDSGILE